MEDAGVISPVHQQKRTKKLIRESGQHLKDVDRILQNDTWYLLLHCKLEERHKQMVHMLMTWIARD